MSERGGGTRRSLSPAPSCEPPLTRAGTDTTPGAALLDRSGTGRRHAVTTRRRTPHDGRSSSYGNGVESDAAAIAFAERSLRMVLEVLDGRRPAPQLRPLAEPTVVAALETLLRTGAPARRLGPAQLAGVRVLPVAVGVCEVCGSYERGGRRFALAGRIVARRGGHRLTALRLR
ncbi:Rv3235 family protein [Nocardia stercoris]|uniref:Uncharacterized protein n=1 Tax=Nocardia stercoris TaxID=2483361 RepID=A0A3M2LC53_9NOCA|nr:Rv3235 family protein [Nocardia stercoris]RMI35129.1 hypothetical protein EBN03_02115 [Nocardia stercoris]